MRKLFCAALMATLLSGFLSCSKNDDNKIKDDAFIVPELTLSNTIQFTINADNVGIRLIG